MFKVTVKFVGGVTRVYNCENVNTGAPHALVFTNAEQISSTGGLLTNILTVPPLSPGDSVIYGLEASTLTSWAIELLPEL